MLDNPQGSSDEVSNAVQALQAARGGEQQDSEQDNLPTDETVVDEEAQELEDGHESESELEEPEEDYSESDGEPELYTVKVGGKEREVSFDQLLENYSKGEDYTNKTMSLADERKALEAQKAEYDQTFSAEKQKLDATMQKLSELIVDQEKAINWEELRDIDPSEYLKQREIQENRKKALNEAQLENNTAREAKRQEALASESQKLLSAIGDEWSDPEVQTKEVKDMYTYIESMGMSPDELSQIIDHRFWVIARQGMKFQQLQKAGSVVKKQVKAAPKTVKSGKPTKRIQREVDAAGSKLRKSGGVDDAVALLRAKRNK